MEPYRDKLSELIRDYALKLGTFALRVADLEEPPASEPDDLTVAYMAGCERGKDAAEEGDNNDPVYFVREGKPVPALKALRDDVAEQKERADKAFDALAECREDRHSLQAQLAEAQAALLREGVRQAEKDEQLECTQSEWERSLRKITMLNTELHEKEQQITNLLPLVSRVAEREQRIESLQADLLDLRAKQDREHALAEAVAEKLERAKKHIISASGKSARRTNLIGTIDAALAALRSAPPGKMSSDEEFYCEVCDMTSLGDRCKNTLCPPASPGVVEEALPKLLRELKRALLGHPCQHGLTAEIDAALAALRPAPAPEEGEDTSRKDIKCPGCDTWWDLPEVTEQKERADEAFDALAECREGRHSLKAQLAEAQADVGSAICARDAYQSETILIARLRAETEAENVKLKTAMKNYSGHLGTCACCDGFECDCGFSELWNELFPEEPAEAGEGESDE